MDFFSLPDVFLRKLMKTASIKDRLNLRLTCRNFEKLVAGTHAGHFSYGYIIHGLLESTFSVRIGDFIMKDFALSQKGVEKFLFLRKQLFCGISIGQFEINMDDYNLTIDILRRITHNIAIDVLSLVLNFESEFEKSMQLISSFSQSKHTLSLGYAPDFAKLLSLPPLSLLDLRYERNPLPNYLFFHRLTVHKSLYLHRVDITAHEFIKTLQIISADCQARSLEFSLDCSTIASWLNGFGISIESETNESFGEFEILEYFKKGRLMRLGYRRCWINILNFDWEGGKNNVFVYISKVAS